MRDKSAQVPEADDPCQRCGEAGCTCEAGPSAEEGRCYMLDTEFKTPAGIRIAAADLTIGAEILDHQGTVRTVTWCRKLPKRKRLLVDLHTKPFTVTSSHRVLVPGGGVIEARELGKNDMVLIGNGCQQLRQVTKRNNCVEVMELEFAGDAIVEVHAPSILTKGSDPSMPIDQAGDIKCKEEPIDEHSMAVDVTVSDAATASADLPRQTQTWPDTDDDLR